MDDLVAGRYRLRRLIASGAMADVHEADDTELERPVALKFLKDEADPLRFEREARTFAALDHPGIARVFDVGNDDRGRFLVLELVGGGTLGDLLADATPLDDGETARIAREIAAALAHAHQRGVVHRDLKPANVLLDHERNVKLADFGIAAATQMPTLTDSGTVLGTASYMAPEQAVGDPTTSATDVYAFGVLLFQMLTGRLPFEGDNAVAVARQHVEAEPPRVTDLRPDADEALAALSAAALAKDPAARPPDGAALLSALGVTPIEPWVELEEPTVALAPVAAASARRRPERAVLTATVIAVLVLSAGFGIAWVLTDEPAPARAPTRTSGSPASTDATTASTAETTGPSSTTRPTTSTASTGSTTAVTPTSTAPSPPPPTRTPTTTTTTSTTPTTVETTTPTTTEATTTDTTTPTTTNAATSTTAVVTTAPAATEPSTTTPEG
jgi:serine/threonine-protein kinase